MEVSSVVYVVKRTKPDIEWTKKARTKLFSVSRIFLKEAFKRCVEITREHSGATITYEFLDRIRNKVNEEKQK